MKRLIIVTIGIAIVIVISLYLNIKENNFEKIEASYSSMRVEIMSVPKDTIIENKTISDNILSSIQLSDWKKLKNFDYSFMPSKIIINIDDKYVFWIDEWDENNEICRIQRRYGGIDSIVGVYKIPVGTVERIEFILNSNDLKWNNLN